MSLTIGIRFLTGYCAAARLKTDPTPEWPPHPARIYMALAAAYFECLPDDAERQALCWLESLDPPLIQFGDQVEKVQAKATTTYVPTNDGGSVGKGGTIQSLPTLKRHRAERLFPRTHLPKSQDCMFLCWPDADPVEADRHRPALSRLCGLVARIGHSTSLVQLWLADRPPDDLLTYAPDDRGTKLRVVARTSGTIDRLSTAFKTPPYRPSIRSAQGYATRRPVPSAAAKTVFNDRLELFRIESAGSSFRWLQLETTLALARTLRDAILERCPVQPPPESISGHAADGKPLESPHIAILPLAYVGHEHADGHLMGVGVALPRSMGEADEHALIDALDQIADVDGQKGTGLGFDVKRFPGLGQWRLIRQGIFDEFRVNLQADRWTAFPDGCRRWASVTPVVFDHHGKSRSKAQYLEECAGLVAESISRVVEGAKVERIRLTPISPILGVPPASDFPRLKRKDGSERRHTHVEIFFDREVIGPLLIGAGRYRGYGFCRPMPEGGMS